MQSVQIYSLKENAERLGMEDRNRVGALRDALVTRLETLSGEASKTWEAMRHLVEVWETNASKPPTAAQPTHLGLSLDLTKYLPSEIKNLAEQQSLMASNQEFLRSLYFSKIRARQNKIESAHSKTFKWIFQPSVPDGPKVPLSPSGSVRVMRSSGYRLRLALASQR